MAKSGLIKNDFSNYYRIQIAWEITSQNIANNTSNVAVKVQLVSLNPNANIVSNTPKNGKLNINGVWYPFTFNTTLAGNQTKTLFTKTVTINHDSNGSKTCSLATECSINVTLSGVYVGTVKATGSGTFDTIPRATVPTLSNDKPTMGNTITITLSRASSEFTHTVKYAWGKDLVLIAKNVTTSTSWTIPLELANGVPNGLTGSGAIVCETYKGSILIGSERVPFSATVPTSVKPTITNITITEAATGLAEKIEAFVQGRSKLSVVVSANGVYGGTIKSYKTTVNGTVYTSGTFETETLLKSGQMDVTTTVTDSRGRSATLTRSINVLAYEIPSISSLSAYRVNETGEKNDEGTFCKVDLSFIISSLNDKNDKSYALDIQESGATEWIPLESGSVYAYNGSYTDANGILNADKPYRVRLTVSDYFTSVTRVYEIPTAYTLLDVHSSCRGIAFGKVSEIEGLFDEAIPLCLGVKYTFHRVQPST